MVDTPRTQAAIQTLFADNTSGAITPQNLRDFVVSVPFYELTAEETAASVTPTDYRYPPCNVKRYGAVGDGTTNDLVAFQNAMASAGSTTSLGQTITIPYGRYFLNGTWHVDKCVVIEGVNASDSQLSAGSELIFPADTDGIRIHNWPDSPTTPQEGTNTVIRNITLYCNSKNLSGRGIYATTTARIEFCSVKNFAGVGIEFYGDTTNGIADFWWLNNVIIRDCGGDGLYLHGNDAQIGTAINCQFMNNGGWGVNNDAPYTNTFISCQSSGNTSGAFSDSNTMSYQGLVLIGCYAEAGATAITDLDESSVVIASPTLGWDYRGSYFGNVQGGTGIACPYNGTIIFASSDGANNRSEKFRLDTQTNVVTGPTRYTVGTDGTLLDKNGLTLKTTVTADYKIASFQNGNGEVGHINTSGTATTYNTSSDYRLKENVQPLQAALDVMNKLNPVTFDWKSDGTSYTGFIAHELQEVIPIAVTGEKDGEEMQAVDQSKIVPFLVAAIKELSAKIDELTR